MMPLLRQSWGHSDRENRQDVFLTSLCERVSRSQTQRTGYGAPVGLSYVTLTASYEIHLYRQFISGFRLVFGVIIGLWTIVISSKPLKRLRLKFFSVR